MKNEISAPEALKNNVRIMLENYHSIHKAALGWSWRRMFGLNRIFNWYDYANYVDSLEEIIQTLKDQQEFCERNRSAKPAELNKYYQTMKDYLVLLITAISTLRDLCSHYEKKDIGFGAGRKLLAQYEEEQARYMISARAMTSAWKAYAQTLKD